MNQQLLANNLLLIVYIKTFLDEKEEIILLDLIALENQKAKTITTQVLNCLYSYGLIQSYLKNKSDLLRMRWSSVVVGRISGVGKLSE
jgi:hypothetical protein